MSRSWDELVEAGLMTISNHQWKLGDLAREVETNYGENSLAKYATALNMEYNTLRRYRDVAKAFPESATRVADWSVCRELAAQSDRVELVASKQWTVAEARGLVNQRKREADQAKTYPERNPTSNRNPRQPKQSNRSESPEPANKENHMGTEEQIQTCLKSLREGKTPTQIAREMDYAGRDSGSFREILAGAKERLRAAGDDSTSNPKRPKNFNGKSNDKRQRELRTEKKTTNYAQLVEFSQRVSEMCAVLEAYDLIKDCGLSDVEQWRLEGLYEDLLSLGEWYDRTMTIVSGRLGSATARKKIEKLRNTEGRSPEETATALRLADRLEEKLEQASLPSLSLCYQNSWACRELDNVIFRFSLRCTKEVGIQARITAGTTGCSPL
jgi:hypothetical protein